MSWVTGDATTKIRSVASILPAVAAASGASPTQNVSSVDDPKPRRLTGVFSTFQTKFLKVQLLVAGKLFMEIDAATFAAAAGFIPCDQVYQPNQQFQYVLVSNNPGGPAVLINTDEIVFRYEATPDIITTS